MPLFDYRCPLCKCNTEEFVHKTDEKVFCSICGTLSDKQFPTQLGPVNFGWPEGGVTMEHAGPEPVHFETREQAKKFAKENNMELGCL